MEVIFTQGNLIHCDLSEFNLLYSKDDTVRIIDFPQWEGTDHPNALSYMARDLENIANFFQKAYGTSFDVDEWLDKFFGTDRAHLEEKNYNKL